MQSQTHTWVAPPLAPHTLVSSRFCYRYGCWVAGETEEDASGDAAEVQNGAFPSFPSGSSVYYPSTDSSETMKLDVSCERTRAALVDSSKFTLLSSVSHELYYSTGPTKLDCALLYSALTDRCP